MTSHDPGVARARPNATDLDKLNPSRRSLDLEPAKPPRLALHLLYGMSGISEPAHRIAESDPRNPSREIRHGREAVGLLPHDASAFLNPQWWLSSELPRGVAWTDYPVVAMPAYEMRRHSPVPVRSPDGSFPSHCPVDDLPERVGVVIVHLPQDALGTDKRFSERTVDWLSKSLVVVSTMNAAAETILVAGAKVVGGLPELRDLAALGEPMLRFRYSYKVNFIAIAGKALEHALSAPDPEAMSLHQAVFPAPWRDDPRLDAAILDAVRKRKLAPGVVHPYALQVLYGLRRRGRVPLTRDTVDWRERNDSWRTDLAYLGDKDGLWRGTGKYEPVRFPGTLVDDISYELAHLMLIRKDGNGLGLSSNGEAFLDALHPDCSDPDLPMRWRGWPLTGNDQEAMDTWIRRVFRKMKKGVNEIGTATPIHTT